MLMHLVIYLYIQKKLFLINKIDTPLIIIILTLVEIVIIGMNF